MSLADPRLHDDALVNLLASVGLVVGDAADPTVPFGWQGTPGQSTFVPYVIVYPLDQDYDGSLGCPDTDSDLSWQATCVGATRDQCDWVRAKVADTLIGASLTVAGRSVPRIRPLGGVGTRRDDSIQPPVFIATPRFGAVSV